MTDETKERIAAINTGIIPDGYKKTKVGIVPIEWEVKKILDFCEIIGGGTPSTKNNDYWNGDIPWISSSDLKDNNIYNINISRYITKKAIEKSATKICPPNTIHLVSRVGVGKIAFSHCRICTSQDFVNIIKYDCDKLYLVYALYQKLQKEINNAQGTSIKGITTQEIKNFLISIPPLSEQQKIAEILSTQDKLIELYERKIEQLKTLKKGYLQKMFPKKGAKSPELRFKGFTDDWEQRELGDMLQTLPFKPYLKAPEQDGIYEVIQQGNEPIIGYANGNPCTDYENSVIFGDHTLSLYKPYNPFFVATDGVRIIKGKNEMAGDYLLPLLEKYKPQSEGYKRYYSILVDRECCYTTNKAEQDKIGQFFHNLDNLITLHQHKLDKEKQKKKALMQLLLTGKVRVST